jgi:hypothetical protein
VQILTAEALLAPGPMARGCPLAPTSTPARAALLQAFHFFYFFILLLVFVSSSGSTSTPAKEALVQVYSDVPATVPLYTCNSVC